MTQRVETLSRTEALEAEIKDLTERVRASVVQVRGSRLGSGSGVIWSAEGLIVTNQHVVPAGDRAMIGLADGRQLKAQVIGRAPDADLAALRIDDLPVDVRLAPAQPVGGRSTRPGELVLAVGNPLGERGAATLGAISGRGTFGSPAGPWDVLRVSILVRPGNSGGALVDVQGRLLGLPFMIVGTRQALAVPADVIDRFLATLDAASPVAPADRYGIAASFVGFIPM